MNKKLILYFQILAHILKGLNAVGMESANLINGYNTAVFAVAKKDGLGWLQ